MYNTGRLHQALPSTSPPTNATRTAPRIASTRYRSARKPLLGSLIDEYT